MGWKTVTGAIVGAIGWLSRPEVLAILPEKVASIVAAAGAVLAAIGVRHAIAKVGGGR
jgi:hypothetical protein